MSSRNLDCVRTLSLTPETPGQYRNLQRHSDHVDVAGNRHAWEVRWCVLVWHCYVRSRHDFDGSTIKALD